MRGILVGDRVVYTLPASTSSATASSAGGIMGTVQAVSGVSALVLYDGRAWPVWGPLERMTVVVGVEGQLSLL